MKTFARLAAISTLLLVGGVHAASVFTGSYTYYNTDQFTGGIDTIDFWFNGSLAADGNTITDISNFGALLNGAAFLDPAATTGYADIYDDPSTLPTITRNGTGDLFEFVNSDGSAFFHVVRSGDGFNIEFGNDTHAASDTLLTPLTVTQTAGNVPEPESTALVLAGLSVVGLMARRLKGTKQA